MDQPEKPWSVPVTIGEIAEDGSHRELTADAATRDAVAGLAGLRALLRLDASFDLVRHGDAIAVRGEVRARVGQTCVVTLDPIENDVHETVDLVFAPGVGEPEQTKKKGKGEPPEPLDDGGIDLGAIATEFLILGVDPYPRKPGVEFTRPPVAESGEHPFAALNALKKRS